MSCVHYQQSNPSKERSYFDGQYSNRYNLPPQYTPRSDNYRNGMYRDFVSEAANSLRYCTTGWRELEFQGNHEGFKETPTSGRGEPSYGDTRLQAGRTAPTYKQETAKHGDATMMEKIQTKMKFLEDSNIVMQTRNQNLITENKALTAQLKEERNEIKRLEKRLTLLREELDFERSKIEEMKKEAEDGKRQMSMGRNTETSTTNIIHKADRGVQVWAVCMGCQRKLESCEKQPPTVTITKSELEVLEKDMQTLRDTIIAREEAWDKAMEREHNYRQQLTRLTTETITARHLSETRNEELKVATNTLLEKESELKSLQKDNLYLNKLIAKLYNYQRGQEGCQRNILAAELNEKDQRFIEEIIRRINGKSKQKPKSKSCCSEKTAHCCSHQSTPREKTSRSAKDQTGYTKEIKR